MFSDISCMVILVTTTACSAVQPSQHKSYYLTGQLPSMSFISLSPSVQRCSFRFLIYISQYVKSELSKEQYTAQESLSRLCTNSCISVNTGCLVISSILFLQTAQQIYLICTHFQSIMYMRLTSAKILEICDENVIQHYYSRHN